LVEVNMPKWVVPVLLVFAIIAMLAAIGILLTNTMLLGHGWGWVAPDQARRRPIRTTLPRDYDRYSRTIGLCRAVGTGEAFFRWPLALIGH
jgi:hypothetical protein